MLGALAGAPASAFAFALTLTFAMQTRGKQKQGSALPSLFCFVIKSNYTMWM
jgi:hypothetical protein